MKNVKFMVAGLAVALICMGVAYVHFAGGGETGPSDAPTDVRRADAKAQDRATRKRARAARAARIAKAAQKPVDEVVKREKPSFELDDADEAALTAEQRALIEAIRKALDEDDHKTVLALVQKLQKAKEWPDGIPLPIRRAALEAVSWIGMSALPEIAGFLGDGDKEVVADAIEAYESALIEANGDRELSAVVTAAAAVIADADAMDLILMSLNEMRPSVAVATIKQIWATGTDAAKAALREAIEFLTGEENITTPEQLDNWYNDPSGDNRDDEDAEEFYGPSQD